MLQLDIGRLSESELEAAVSHHCAQFGTIKSIRVHAPTVGREYGIATVEMSAPAEADKVVGKMGDLKFGSTAIVRLVQEGKPIPVSLENNAGSGIASDPRAPLEILLVEDNPADVRMALEALKAVGIPHNLHVVEDGLTAISFLNRTRKFDHVAEPDLVLLDLNIPKFDGHEVLGEIKASNDLKHIPVVILTCSKAEKDIQKSNEMNADYFVTKSTGLEAFAKEMKKIEAMIR